MLDDIAMGLKVFSMCLFEKPCLLTLERGETSMRIVLDVSRKSLRFDHV